MAQVTNPQFNIGLQLVTQLASGRIPAGAIVTTEERESVPRLGWRYWFRYEQTAPQFLSATGCLFEDELAAVPQEVSA